MTGTGFYDRLKAERARANQLDTPEYDACVRETVDELLARETTSRHPGMLLGKIQSGKTRAFLGIIALAFDKGFDVAVVLTKGTKTLGNQTVRRISTDFKSFRDDNAMQVFDILKIPTLTPWELEEQKLVIVAKKEHNNMRRLIELFGETHPELRAKRVLIVDDEADFASVRFAKKKGTDVVDQGRIANQMDELRRELDALRFPPGDRDALRSLPSAGRIRSANRRQPYIRAKAAGLHETRADPQRLRGRRSLLWRSR